MLRERQGGIVKNPVREPRWQVIVEHPSTDRRQENVVEDVSIYETIVYGTIVICCLVVLHALRVILR